MKNRLEDAYSLLLSRNWIAQDPSSGDSFCRVTEDGARQLAHASGPDAERVAFAAPRSASRQSRRAAGRPP